MNNPNSMYATLMKYGTLDHPTQHLDILPYVLSPEDVEDLRSSVVERAETTDNPEHINALFDILNMPINPIVRRPLFRANPDMVARYVNFYVEGCHLLEKFMKGEIAALGWGISGLDTNGRLYPEKHLLTHQPGHPDRRWYRSSYGSGYVTDIDQEDFVSQVRMSILTDIVREIRLEAHYRKDKFCVKVLNPDGSSIAGVWVTDPSLIFDSVSLMWQARRQLS